ncbi:uncharacterized protein LOC128960719 [Oppia nitens]|uniref:uncharacterized protein LOC128960719 n=1 Tax=Oppia nitens TaxID=1686743 RepID=UPI0023DC404B|nr:uncharacterized protein LOC128960719 [Oppia nitens]
MFIRSMDLTKISIICVQSVLIVLQFFAFFGSLATLVNSIWIYTHNNTNKSDRYYYYPVKELILLIVIFVISMITQVLGIFSNTKKNYFLLILYVVLLLIQVIIFFVSDGLLLLGIWDTVIIFLTLVLIALIQQEGWLRLRNRRLQRATAGVVANGVVVGGGGAGAGAGSVGQQYAYLDNNPPPDYNTAVMTKPTYGTPPPAYQSVELMAVSNGGQPAVHWQRY